jgi:hypothetical protein
MSCRQEYARSLVRLPATGHLCRWTLQKPAVPSRSSAPGSERGRRVGKPGCVVHKRTSIHTQIPFCFSLGELLHEPVAVVFSLIDLLRILKMLDDAGAGFRSLTESIDVQLGFGVAATKHCSHQPPKGAWEEPGEPRS